MISDVGEPVAVIGAQARGPLGTRHFNRLLRIQEHRNINYISDNQICICLDDLIPFESEPFVAHLEEAPCVKDVAGAAHSVEDYCQRRWCEIYVS